MRVRVSEGTKECVSVSVGLCVSVWGVYERVCVCVPSVCLPWGVGVCVCADKNEVATARAKALYCVVSGVRNSTAQLFEPIFAFAQQPCC